MACKVSSKNITINTTFTFLNDCRFKFPGIFIFYQMLSSLVYAVVFVMSYVDFKSLFCRSMDLIENLMPGNETPMCTISG